MDYRVGDHVWVPIEQQAGRVTAAAQGWAKVRLDDGRVRALIHANLKRLCDRPQSPGAAPTRPQVTGPDGAGS